MKATTKILFPFAVALMLASCGGGQPSASSAPASEAATSEKQSEASAASSKAAESTDPGKQSEEGPAASSEAAPGKSEAEPVVSSEESAPTSQSSQGSQSEHKDANVITEPTTIYFMSNFSYQDPIDKAIELFKAVEPNVTVLNIKETGGYPDVKNKAISQLATNEHPDLIVAYPDAVQELIDYNAVVKLDDYMDNPVYGWTEDEREDAIETYLDEGCAYPIPGYYSLPFAKSTEAMYYNKDVLIGLNLAGVDPTINGGNSISEEYLNNLTWEDLFGHLIPALQAYDQTTPILTGSKYKHSIFGYDSDDNLFITLAQQYGYGYTSIDEYGEGHIDFVNDGMKNLMKTFNAAYKAGGFITKGSNNGDYTNYSFTDNCSLFSVGSTGGAKYQYSENFTTGVARIPHAAGRDPYVINQGPSLAVLKHDDNRALASWLFYKFFTNTANNAAWAATTGYSPVRYSVLEDPDYMDVCNPAGKDKDDLMKAITCSYAGEVGNDLFASPVFKGSSEARSQVGSLFTNCLLAEDIDAEIDGLFTTAYQNTLKAM